MKQLFAFFITLITISLPALGQWPQQRPQLSPDDQRRFDSYYSRRQDYRRDNNQSEVNSMERRMWDVMDQYKIPRDVSFDEIASGQRY